MNARGSFISQYNDGSRCNTWYLSPCRIPTCFSKPQNSFTLQMQIYWQKRMLCWGKEERRRCKSRLREHKCCEFPASRAAKSWMNSQLCGGRNWESSFLLWHSSSRVASKVVLFFSAIPTSEIKVRIILIVSHLFAEWVLWGREYLFQYQVYTAKLCWCHCMGAGVMKSQTSLKNHIVKLLSSKDTKPRSSHPRSAMKIDVLLQTWKEKH